jgi:hypothetical protein
MGYPAPHLGGRPGSADLEPNNNSIPRNRRRKTRTHGMSYRATLEICSIAQASDTQASQL